LAVLEPRSGQQHCTSCYTISPNLIKNPFQCDSVDPINCATPGGRQHPSCLLPQIGNSQISIDHSCPSLPLPLHQCPLPNSRTCHIWQLLRLLSTTVALSCPFSCSPLARRAIKGYAWSCVAPLCPFVPFQQAPSTRRYRVGQLRRKVLVADTHCCVTSSERTC
jgi:hypothetical protein